MDYLIEGLLLFLSSDKIQEISTIDHHLPGIEFQFTDIARILDDV